MASFPDARELLERFHSQLARTLATPGPDEIHDLRVALRRFSQALSATAHGSASANDMRDAMKRLMKFAGAVRDYDIALKLIAKSGGSKALMTRLRRERGRREALLIRKSKDWMRTHPIEKWRDLVASLPARRASDAVAARISKLFKRGAQAETSDRRLHPLRIAAKKLRYTLELFQPSGSVAKIKELQTKLGDINDFAAVSRLAAKQHAPRKVLESLARKREKHIRAFRKYWTIEFSGRKAEWTKSFQGSPSHSPSGKRKGKPATKTA